MRLDHPSPSPARLAANRANALLSTGPKSEEGRAVVSQNRWRHGLSGAFAILPWEVEADFTKLTTDLRAEHKPSTPTENLLVDRMAQHHWLMQRALTLQGGCFSDSLPLCDLQKDLALYLRYQTTHERAFHKCLNELIKLRTEARRARAEEAAAQVKKEIGFESQKRLAAAEARKQAAENRAETLHVGRLELLECRIAAQKARMAQPKPAQTVAVGLQTAA